MQYSRQKFRPEIHQSPSHWISRWYYYSLTLKPISLQILESCFEFRKKIKMSVNLELLWPCKYDRLAGKCQWCASGLLDEHFSGVGGDSSFGCFLFLLFLWAVAATARITTKQVTNFIPSRIFHPTAHNISNYHSALEGRWGNCNFSGENSLAMKYSGTAPWYSETVGWNSPWHWLDKDREQLLRRQVI